MPEEQRKGIQPYYGVCAEEAFQARGQAQPSEKTNQRKLQKAEARPQSQEWGRPAFYVFHKRGPQL